MAGAPNLPPPPGGTGAWQAASRTPKLRRTGGTPTYLVTPEHTSRVRAELGAGPLIAAEQGVVLETDPGTARAIARENLASYLILPNRSRPQNATGTGAGWQP